MSTVQLWIGTYPAAGAGSPTGRGEGIWSVQLDPETGQLDTPRLAAVTPAPSFLALHPTLPVLYAVAEDSVGALAAFRVAGSALEPMGVIETGGADPCHLVVTADGAACLVAHYSSGSVAAVGLEADGSLSPRHALLEGPAGGGPRVDRQDGPHAHFLHQLTATTALVVDLGRDEVRRLRVTATPDDVTVEDDGVALTLPAGAGPRHIAFDTAGTTALVAAELEGSVYAVRWDPARRAGVVTGVAGVAAPAPADHVAHVAALASGGYVVGVRGADVLREVTVTADGDPWLAATAELPGRWPRHHAVVGRWIVTAEQIPGSLTVVDTTTWEVAGSVPLPSAACVLVAAG